MANYLVTVGYPMIPTRPDWIEWHCRYQVEADTPLAAAVVVDKRRRSNRDDLRVLDVCLAQETPTRFYFGKPPEEGVQEVR